MHAMGAYLSLIWRRGRTPFVLRRDCHITDASMTDENPGYRTGGDTARAASDG